MPQGSRSPAQATDVLVALGGNLAATPEEGATVLRAAAKQLSDLGLRRLRLSAIYRNPAWPAGSGPDFVNAVARAETDLSPDAVLAMLHRVEDAFGRERPHRWAPRWLDLDLIAHGAAVAPDRETWAAWQGLPPEDQARRTPDRLILPHPRLHDRAFVLVPLAEVAPGWQHPVTGAGVGDLIAALPGDQVAQLARL